MLFSIEPFVTPSCRWKGKGQGSYPTLSDFTYEEEVEFRSHPTGSEPASHFFPQLALLGKPVFSYTQKTWHPASHQPMHAETGYLKACPPSGDGKEHSTKYDLIVSQVTGFDLRFIITRILFSHHSHHTNLIQSSHV